MKKTVSGLIATLLLLAILITGACGDRKDTQGQTRIVALSPEVAEIIASLGGTSLLVGVTQECKYPPELARIKKVGNFGAVSREAVLALKPDLVFTSALEQDALTTDLAKMGLTVKQIYPKKLDDLPLVVLQIGELIGKTEEAKILADSLSSGIAAMRDQTAGKTRPKVYLEIYRDPLMSVSDDSFVGEIIEAAGGDNIFSTLERDYARVSPEAVVKAQPDIIICYSRDSLESILARKGWQDIPAVRSRRVYFETDIDPDLIQQATPRTLEGMRRLYKLFFPSEE